MDTIRTPEPGDVVLYEHHATGTTGAFVMKTIDAFTVRLFIPLDPPVGFEWAEARYDPTGHAPQSWRWKPRDLAEAEYRMGIISLSQYLDILGLPRPDDHKPSFPYPIRADTPLLALWDLVHSPPQGASVMQALAWPNIAGQFRVKTAFKMFAGDEPLTVADLAEAVASGRYQLTRIKYMTPTLAEIIVADLRQIAPEAWARGQAHTTEENTNL